MSDETALPQGQPGDELVGRAIGQYKIIRELGRGGMATVYLAKQINMNRQVAIKVLPREFLHDPQFIERFKREVQLIAELEHPHILPVYDFGEHDRIPFIVMRFLGGGSLLDMLNQGLPPLADLQKPFWQVCSALDFAHAEGIIHRDLKPSNIMLDERGNAYLSDFGIAQIMQDAGRLTGSAVIGTPAYMSPEQAEGRPLDARADVYALGVVLFEMVTGREPYQADTPMAMLLKQITEPMPSPRAYRPGLPQAIEEVILRATLKDPAARYPSALAFGEALNTALGNLSHVESSLRLPRSPAVERTQVPGSEAPPPPEDDELPTYIGTDAPAVPMTEPPLARPLPPESDLMTATPATDAETAAGSTQPGTPVTQQAQPQPSGRRGLWFGLAAVLVIAMVVVGLLASGALNPPAPTEAVFQPPTPFAGANLYRGPSNVYQISIPGDWQRQTLSAAEAGGDGLAVLWSALDDGAYIVLRLQQAAEADTVDLIGWADAEADSRYADPVLFAPIDRAAQLDDSLRASYRVPQPEALYERFGAGQLDVFYYAVGPYRAALEVFLGDGSSPDDLLPVMQDVLDSVYIDSDSNWRG
jgi:serine/threonine protein kinase